MFTRLFSLHQKIGMFLEKCNVRSQKGINVTLADVAFLLCSVCLLERELVTALRKYEENKLHNQRRIIK